MQSINFDTFLFRPMLPHGLCRKAIGDERWDCGTKSVVFLNLQFFKFLKVQFDHKFYGGSESDFPEFFRPITEELERFFMFLWVFTVLEIFEFWDL